MATRITPYLTIMIGVRLAVCFGRADWSILTLCIRFPTIQASYFTWGSWLEGLVSYNMSRRPLNGLIMAIRLLVVIFGGNLFVMIACRSIPETYPCTTSKDLYYLGRS